MDGTELRRAREQAGLSQAALARISGVAQPNISAYESGRRPVSTAAARSLRRALRPYPGQVLEARSEEVRAVAQRYGLTDVRVFGSARWGCDTHDSDVDLLVHVGPGAGAYALVHAAEEITEVLAGIPVDLVSDAGRGASLERIKAEAMAL